MPRTHRFVEVRDVKVPALGLGTWRLAGENCQTIVRAALDLGYRHIDTAQLYFNEQDVGRAIRESTLPREMIFLTTKLAFDKVRRQDVLATTEESLSRLKTEYVDLLLIHWPSATVPLEETLEAMALLHQQSKVHHIGVSNFPSQMLRHACKISPLPIITNQVEYHPYLSQQKVLQVCREEQVMLTAYAPTARAKVIDDPAINAIAARHGKSPIQVTLRWLLQQPLVSAIPKSAHPDRVQSNFDVFDFELSDSEMNSIFALARGERLCNTDIAPRWDE